MPLVDVDVPLEVETADGTRRPLTPEDIRGPAGPAGGQAYVHDQSAPANEWVIAHELGRFPSSVLCVDTGGTVVIGGIHLDSPDQVTVTFTVPIAGKAYLQ